MSAVTTKKTDVDSVKSNLVDVEILDQQEPIAVRGILQFMLPSPDESIRKIHSGITDIQNTLSNHTGFHQSIFDQLSVMNTTLYQQMPDKNASIMDDEIVKTLQDISVTMDALAGVFASLPEWIPAHTLQESTGLTVDTIRKQLQNPRLFEPEVDYRRIGRIWYINKSAIPKVRRQK